MNILVVDDDSGVREMLFSHLVRRHAVSVVCDGHNALSLLADPKHGFDLVLMDLKMPRLDGASVVKSIGDWVSVPVKFVIISGMLDERKLRNLPNVISLLQKPFSLTQIDEIVTRASNKQMGPITVDVCEAPALT